MIKVAGRDMFVLMPLVLLNYVGVGLAIPIVPALVSEEVSGQYYFLAYSTFVALYSVGQFIFAPLLGMLSDRIGRRPVIMLSLAGSAVDSLIMVLSSSFAVLCVGRFIGGATSATTALILAYASDQSDPESRATRFGRLNAYASLGLIAGPLLGGWLGEAWVRLPYVFSCAFAICNLALAAAFIPGAASRSSILEARAPFARGLDSIFGAGPTIPRLLAAYAIVVFVGNVGAVIWVIYAQSRFGWGLPMVGASLAVYAVCQFVLQGYAVSPLIARLGHSGTVILAALADWVASLFLSLAGNGTQAFLLIPLLCLGGIGIPALQGMLSCSVSSDAQGKLQGGLSSINAVVSMAGPFIASSLFFASVDFFPGMIWVVAGSAYLLVIPLVRYSAESTRSRLE